MFDAISFNMFAVRSLRRCLTKPRPLWMVAIPCSLLFFILGRYTTSVDTVNISPYTTVEQKTTFSVSKPADKVIDETKTLAKIIKNYTYIVVELDGNLLHHFKSESLTFSYEYSTVNPQNYVAALKHRSQLSTAKTNDRRRNDWRGYVAVDTYGQELSQCSKHLLRLAYLMASGRRKVLAPRMLGTVMGNGGRPFWRFYNVQVLNKALSKYGYSELAAEEEYNKNCKNKPKVVVHIFYNPSDILGIRFNRTTFQKLYGRVKRNGWQECSRYYIGPKPKDRTHYYCVHSTAFIKMNVLNKNVFKDAKCIVFPRWNWLGLDVWTPIEKAFPQNILLPHQIFSWLMNPSDAILEEVKAFQELKIQRPYVGIHIRGVKFKNHSLISKCFQVALKFVEALRRTRNVKTLFLSTDMSEYGGGTNKDITSHESFAKQSKAVTYNPKVTGKVRVVDRWIVSLTEVTLLEQSDHLITIGYGSFHGFVVNRYITAHLKQDLATWTWTKVCHKTGSYHKL